MRDDVRELASWVPIVFDVVKSSVMSDLLDQAAVSVQRADILSPMAQALIEALNTELTEVYPEEGACHFRLDANEVANGNGAFLIAFRSSKPVGCGAVRRIDANTGELKRMYVLPEERGRRVGQAILSALENEAKTLHLTRLVLETGVRQDRAQRLYRQAGFSPIDKYGEYTNSPLSICMAKEL